MKPAPPLAVWPKPKDDERVMSPRFTPCPACSRHVKRGDGPCPFCGGTVPHVAAPPARAAAGRLSRSALFAASAVGVALSTADCSSPSPLPPYGTVPFYTPDDAASEDAADGGSSTPADAAREAQPTEGGSNGAMVAPADGGGD